MASSNTISLSVALLVITTFCYISGHPTQPPQPSRGRLDIIPRLDSMVPVRSSKPLGGNFEEKVWPPNSNFAHTDLPQSDAPRELINLASMPSINSPCATVWTTTLCLLQVPDDSIHKNIQDRNFIYAASSIKPQCSLTIQDCTGSHYSSYFNNFLV